MNKSIRAFLTMTSAFMLVSPALAQTAPGTPAFRVPIGGEATATSSPPVFAWMQNVGTCSSACGSGTRTTSYQCQNVNDFDFSGAGYGAPEADASCSAAGAKPASSSTSCTNYSGCTYDWVKPPVATQILPMPNPAGGTFDPGGANDCSYAKRTFSPYCQRGGSTPVQLPIGDHTFCKNDTPDYDDVAANRPDALGFDRTTPIDTACTAGARDNKWTTTGWTANPLVCGSIPTQRRSVSCIRKFNGATRPDSDCSSMTKPSLVEDIGTTPNTSACGYEWSVGAWGAYGSACSTSTPRSRTVTCRRSDNTTVADSFCSAQSAKPATSESGSNLVGCTYEWTTPTAWTYASPCSTSTSRTRTTTCRRSDGTIVADSQCVPGDKPTTFEGGVSNTGSCTYTPRDVGRSACTNNNIEQYWDCTRQDGQTGFPATMCGKTNPENIACVSYTYTPREIGRTTCAGSQQQVSWDCTRSDGATGYPASFCGKTSPQTVSCTMPPVYTYTPVNRGETACSGSQKQVYWDCTRNDGQTGFPASMCGKTNPETQSCVMPYTYSPVYRGETACSGSQKQVYWDCTRSDGQTGFPASMCGKSSPETQACTMPFTYTPVYRGESACSGSQKNVYWDCTRSDGQQGFPASMCGKTNPEVQSCVMPYMYTPVYRGETACSGSQKQVYWDCTRSDGQTGFPASMCGKTNPETQSCTMPVTYLWQYDGWSSYNSTCSNSATRTRNVWCQGSDGSRPGDGPCGGGKPASSETTGVYSSCTYTNEDTGNSGCQSGTITYNTQCRRSDGNLVATSNCGNNGTRTESCPTGYAHGTILGTYAFNSCSMADNYGTTGTMPGIDQSLCQSRVATYARRCSNGGNIDSNAACSFMPYVNNPRGPSGYPCDIICR